MTINETKDRTKLFSNGNGMLLLHDNMPDDVLLKLLKKVISHSNSKQVIVSVIPGMNERGEIISGKETIHDLHHEWMRNRDICMSREVVKGATYKSAGESYGLSRSQAQDIVRRLLKKTIEHETIDAPCDPYAITEVREHKDYWLARINMFERNELNYDWMTEMDQMQILMQPIKALGLPARTANVLVCWEIFSIGDLVKQNEAELLGLQYLGEKSIAEIKDALDACGLSLGTRIHAPVRCKD